MDLWIFKVITDSRQIVCQRWLQLKIKSYGHKRENTIKVTMAVDWQFEPWIQAELSPTQLLCLVRPCVVARCEQTRLWTGTRNSLSCWQILAQILVSICQKIRAPSEIQFISLFGFSAAAPDGGPSSALAVLLWLDIIIGFNSAAVKKQNNYNFPVKTDPFRAESLSWILWQIYSNRVHLHWSSLI